MKSLQAPNLKIIALTKTMYPVIHNYDEQTFDNMSEESEKKKTLSLRNHCGLFQVKARLSRPKNMAASDSREVTEDMPQEPTESGDRGCT